MWTRESVRKTGVNIEKYCPRRDLSLHHLVRFSVILRIQQNTLKNLTWMNFWTLWTYELLTKIRETDRWTEKLSRRLVHHMTQKYSILFTVVCAFSKCKSSYIANYKILALDKQILSTLIDVFSKATHKENYINFLEDLALCQFSKFLIKWHSILVVFLSFYYKIIVNSWTQW